MSYFYYHGTFSTPVSSFSRQKMFSVQPSRIRSRVVSRYLPKFRKNLSDSNFRVWTIILDHEGYRFFETLAPIYQITRSDIPQSWLCRIWYSPLSLWIDCTSHEVVGEVAATTRLTAMEITSKAIISWQDTTVIVQFTSLYFKFFSLLWFIRSFVFVTLL
jgi:hypothetical protein